jgi:dolichol-phosphate mannosyltransferase
MAKKSKNVKKAGKERACIIIPTYNEAENIEPLLKALFEEFKKIDEEMHVLVVDDSSPDGTAKVVKRYTRRKNVHLLVRKHKEGLGKAYMAGFQWAKRHRMDIVFEMDADFSHNPKELWRFLSQMKNHDFVIGSRYIGPGHVLDWSWDRRIVSWGGNALARYIAGIPVNDCTSGYRCISMKVIKKIDMKNIHTKGYAFQISLLKRAIKAGARIKEIPIVFRDRRRGKSKLGKGQFFEFLWTCMKLRFS